MIDSRASGLGMEDLVREAGLVTRVDLGGRPGLTSPWSRLGVHDALVDPALGEPVVVDPPGVAGRIQVVGGAERRDRGKVRGIGPRHHQLGQPRVRDADHAHLVVEHPGLCPHGLDDVVSVVVRRQAEQVERPTRATGAAHLDAHGDEAEKWGDDRSDDRARIGKQRVLRRRLSLERVDQAVRSRDGIARVLDHRREWTVCEGLAGRQPDRRSQRDPVADLDVVESHMEVLAGVERRRRQDDVGQHGERGRGLGLRPARLLEPVAGAGCQVLDDQSAELVDNARSDPTTGLVHHRQQFSGLGAEYVGLVDRAVPAKRRRRHRGARGARHSEQHAGHHEHGQGHAHQRLVGRETPHGRPLLVAASPAAERLRALAVVPA